MQCTKCNKGSCILVTTQMKNDKRVREHQGLFMWIITAPVRWFKFIFRYGVAGRRETYQKENVWRCNYCSHMLPQTFNAPVASVDAAPAEQQVSGEQTNL